MKKYLVLFIYDISDNKRRLKLSKLLESYGMRVQKSGFEAFLSRKLFDKMITEIRKVIVDDDNVRVYRLNGYEELKVFGGKDYRFNDDDYIII